MMNKNQIEKIGILIIGLMLGITITSIIFNSRINFLENSLINNNGILKTQNETISNLNEKINLLEQNTSEKEKSSIFYGDITPKQASKLLNTQRPPVIIDVRSELEYNESRISKAKNIPINDLTKSIETLHREEEYIIYCKSGYRSQQALKILENNGFNRTYNIIGGINAWKESMLPVSEKCPCEEE